MKSDNFDRNLTVIFNAIDCDNYFCDVQSYDYSYIFTENSIRPLISVITHNNQ